MVASPEPETSQSDAASPGFRFSHTTRLMPGPQGLPCERSVSPPKVAAAAAAIRAVQKTRPRDRGDVIWANADQQVAATPLAPWEWRGRQKIVYRDKQKTEHFLCQLAETEHATKRTFLPVGRRKPLTALRRGGEAFIKV